MSALPTPYALVADVRLRQEMTLNLGAVSQMLLPVQEYPIRQDGLEEEVREDGVEAENPLILREAQ